MENLISNFCLAILFQSIRFFKLLKRFFLFFHKIFNYITLSLQSKTFLLYEFSRTLSKTYYLRVFTTLM